MERTLSFIGRKIEDCQIPGVFHSHLPKHKGQSPAAREIEKETESHVFEGISLLCMCTEAQTQCLGVIGKHSTTTRLLQHPSVPTHHENDFGEPTICNYCIFHIFQDSSHFKRLLLLPTENINVFCRRRYFDKWLLNQANH